MNSFKNPSISYLIAFFFLLLLPTLKPYANTLDKKFIVKGIFLDKETGESVQGVSVLILNTKDQSKISLVTGENGEFKVTLNDLAEYKIQGSKPMHLFSSEQSVSTYHLSSNTHIDLEFKIERIHFNTPYLLPNFKFHLNEDAFVEVDLKYIQLLKEVIKQHADVKIVIRNHTDARGDDSYNLMLSQKRANQIKSLLTQQGISSKDIEAIGLGETELLNECENNIKCSTADHLINRRSEFSIESR